MNNRSIYNFVKKHKISKSLFVGYFMAFTIILYFLSFAFFGQKGLVKYFSVKKEITKKESVGQQLLNTKKNKQNMVNGMSADSLDLDLLDEQARKSLGYASKNEVVIYKEDKEEKK